MYDIIIIGGGPAGLTAAVYARRAGRSVLVIEKDTFGGQIAHSPRVENFPGCISVSGLELADRLLSHAMETGADTELEEAVSLHEESGTVTVGCASGAEFTCRAVILAGGAKPRPLGLPREEELAGCGVSYCAVCDGAFFKDRDVAVVGGGSSALQEALLLSETCGTVYIIHRRDSFRGEPSLSDALKKRTNVRFVMNSRVTGLLGDGELTGITVHKEAGGLLSGTPAADAPVNASCVTDAATQDITIPVEGLFIAAGRIPELKPFSGLLDLDAGGYGASGEDCLTRTPWLFIAGDCRAKEVRQLTTAAADGAVAALAAVKFTDRSV